MGKVLQKMLKTSVKEILKIYLWKNLDQKFNILFQSPENLPNTKKLSDDIKKPLDKGNSEGDQIHLKKRLF